MPAVALALAALAARPRGDLEGVLLPLGAPPAQALDLPPFLETTAELLTSQATAQKETARL